MRYLLLLLVAGWVWAGTTLTLTSTRLTDEGITVTDSQLTPGDRHTPTVLAWQGEINWGNDRDATGYFVWPTAPGKPVEHHNGTLLRNTVGLCYAIVDDVARRTGFAKLPTTSMRLSTNHLLVSPDGRRTAVVERHNDGRSTPAPHVLVVDGTARGTYDDVYLMRFSPDSRHFTCWVRQGTQWLILTDGEEITRYTLVEESITFDAYGHRIARDHPTGVLHPMTSTPQSTYTNLRGWPESSPNGRHLAYVIKDGDRCRMVRDDKPGPWYDDIPAHKPSLAYSPDSRHFAYTAKVGTHMLVVADGRPGKRYDAIMALKYSPDSRRLGYIAKRGKQYLLVIDGREEAPHDRVSQPRFSANGRHLAYAYQDGGTWRLRWDGRDGPGFLGVGLEDGITFAISADGRHLAYLAWDKHERYLLLDGTTLLPMGNGNLRGLCYSPDSRRLAYVLEDAMGKQAHLVVDSRTLLTTADPIHLYGFTNDSAHVLYTTGTKLGIDDAQQAMPGLPLRPFPQAPTAPATAQRLGFIFDTPASFHCFTQTDGILYRVDGRLATDAPTPSVLFPPDTVL